MRTNYLICFCVTITLSSFAYTAERPTLLRTNDPRPDILPRPFYDHHNEYRAVYNRPRNFGGWLAYNVSRTSQEAMVWEENHCAGNYARHHMPPVYKSYYYPKPWEVLNVGARPDTLRVAPSVNVQPENALQPEDVVPESEPGAGSDKLDTLESSRKAEAEPNAKSNKQSETEKLQEKSDAEQAKDKLDRGNVKELVPSPSGKAIRTKKTISPSSLR